KLAGDLATGEEKSFLEELHPFFLGQRMMRVKPARKASVRLTDLEYATRVFDDRIDLEFVANDPRVAKQSRSISTTVAGYNADVKIIKGLAEAFSLFQNRQPVQTRLIDFKRQPFKERVVGANRKPVFALVVGPVKWMTRS